MLPIIVDESIVGSYPPGLKPGRVIRVIQVTFCLGQAGLTRFIKYLGLTQILNWITCILLAFGSDQSNELSMLDGDDGPQ